MERLWAPWRLNYVTGGDDKKKTPQKVPGCIFCDKPTDNDDNVNMIVARGATCYVILNAYPYNNGHLMVVPYRHIASPVELTDEEGTEMMQALSATLTGLGTAYHADGYNVGMNVGAAAGAGIAAHLHLHVVPRWNGDTNFMPVVGDVKVMPESLEQTFARVKAALENQDREQDGNG